MSKYALSLSDVYIDYDGTNVVHGASFNVAVGDVFGLVGLNGAGKTSLIKTILGLHDALSGDIKVLGASNRSAVISKDVVYLPERFEPSWFLNGMEFIQFSLSLYGRQLDEARVYAAADKLALDRAALKKRVQTYSKGMRQKLGLIATVLSGCKLLILDEPMSGLDPRARSSVKDMLMDMKQADQTLVICSHILADLDEICDEIAIVHEGRVDFCDKPQKLKDLSGQKALERAFLKYIERNESNTERARA